MTADRVRIRLEPLGVELDVARGGSLVAALSAHGVEFPCGGIGECGGCGVRVLSGALPVTDADRAVFPPDQLAAGWRLACHARAESPLVLECGQWRMEVLADTATPARTETVAPSFPRPVRKGWESITKNPALGIAIDLGTTTIAAQLVDPASGSVLGVETLLNPQAAFGSDVMSRIRAALDGRDLTTPIRAALGQVVARLAAGREPQIAEVLLVGNTVMHHLFSGLSVEPLSRVPFQSPHLGEQRFTPRDLAWDLPAACTIRFVRCIGGFVGSDILAGIVAAGMGNGPDLTALIDLGTNGEIAIGNRAGIVCASTAAGPAFEAGAIRMGMRAVTGAIAYVTLASGALSATVIGDVAPRGICGSGLVDAVAAGLRSGAILSNGRVANGTKLFPIAPPVVLYQSDIRELQLAKAAVASGFRLLLKRLAAGSDSLRAIHLAGAFGNYVQIDSAIRIGLIEAPPALIHAAGNTALRGAKLLLLSAEEPPLPPIEHVSLAADPAFQDEFAGCMTFPNPL
ncbi:MAG: ASKHA domain-containing protein [Terracidiphilus sp.]